MTFKACVPFVLSICALSSCMTMSPIPDAKAPPAPAYAKVASSAVEDPNDLHASTAQAAESASVSPAKTTSANETTSASGWNGLLVSEAPVTTATMPPPPPAAPVAAADHSYQYPTAGSWEFTIGGSGNADKHFDNGGFALAASLGYYFTDIFEIVARQNAQFSDFGNSQFFGQTRVALDLNLLEGPVRPVIGANVGYVYGDQVHDTWSAAPEVGVKIYLQKNVFLSLMGEYQFFFQKGSEIDDQFDTGAFLFEVALGLNF